MRRTVGAGSSHGKAILLGLLGVALLSLLPSAAACQPSGALTGWSISNDAEPGGSDSPSLGTERSQFLEVPGKPAPRNVSVRLLLGSDAPSSGPYSVDWGDGSTTNATNETNLVHQYRNVSWRPECRQTDDVPSSGGGCSYEARYMVRLSTAPAAEEECTVQRDIHLNLEAVGMRTSWHRDRPVPLPPGDGGAPRSVISIGMVPIVLGGGVGMLILGALYLRRHPAPKRPAG